MSLGTGRHQTRQEDSWHRQALGRFGMEKE